MTAQPDSNRSARLAVAATALLFSTGGAAIKLTTLSVWQVASYRAAVATVALWLILPAARRGWTRRTFAVGAVHGATMILFVAANKLTTAASTIFLQSTAPLYVLLLAPLALGERLRRIDLLYAAALAAGLLLLVAGTSAPAETAPDPFTGNLLAAGGGLCWGLTIVGLRWLGRDPDTQGEQAAVCTGNLLACLACLPLALAGGGSPEGAARAADLVLILFLGVIQIALPYALLTRAIRRLGALEAILLLLLEPVLNPAWAWVLLGEVPSGFSLAGGGVVLGATVTKAWIEERGRTNLTASSRP